jgi:hypothetical protein
MSFLHPLSFSFPLSSLRVFSTLSNISHSFPNFVLCFHKFSWCYPMSLGVSLMFSQHALIVILSTTKMTPLGVFFDLTQHPLLYSQCCPMSLSISWHCLTPPSSPNVFPTYPSFEKKSNVLNVFMTLLNVPQHLPSIAWDSHHALASSWHPLSPKQIK